METGYRQYGNNNSQYTFCMRKQGTKDQTVARKTGAVNRGHALVWNVIRAARATDNLVISCVMVIESTCALRKKNQVCEKESPIKVDQRSPLGPRASQLAHLLTLQLVAAICLRLACCQASECSELNNRFVHQTIPVRNHEKW